MKVWVVRYFLTEGIFLSEDGEIDKFGDFRTKKGRGDCYYLLPKQYRHTREEALQYAEDRRRKRLDSLKDQIVKLEAMRWER